MTCGVGHRCGLDLACLWWRSAAAALIRPPGLGTSICRRCSPKRTKAKKKKKEEEKRNLFKGKEMRPSSQDPRATALGTPQGREPPQGPGAPINPEAEAAAPGSRSSWATDVTGFRRQAMEFISTCDLRIHEDR